MSDDLRTDKESAWREVADLDAALELGRITENDWHAAVLAIVEASYLSADNPRGQSGHSGDEGRWEQARRLLVDALPGSCSFLDVGCANGYLMESLVGWAAEEGMTVEPYGLDISARLTELARRRLPDWADRIWTANILGWLPPLRFDAVRTGLDYAPPHRRADLVAHLVAEVVAPGGRLVVGTFNEESDLDTLESRMRSWGYTISGRTARPHRNPGLAYKAFWLDLPQGAPGSERLPKG
ncbi:MAG: SAM-dependent methyltransferase [Geodermatophilaceae bacterium]|nr:SAM-dependent methyltransferase [Geodermatophilaceae bacterium]